MTTTHQATAQVLAFPKPDSYQRAEGKHQERADAIASATERLHEELRVSVLIGMVQPSAGVRPAYVRRGVDPARDVVLTQSMAEAVHETLEYEDVLAQLMTVLEVSECPEVLKLRQCIAQRYALTHAADVAAAQVPQ